MDLAFGVWGCGGNCCQVTGSGATLWAIALALLFPLLTLHSSLDELYGESLPRFLEAILLQYD